MKNLVRKLRVILYIIIIIALIFLKYTSVLNFPCYIQSKTGIPCPTCGFTRATQALLKLDIKSAVEYNAFFTMIFLPIFLILLIQDVGCIIISKIKGKEYISWVDIIFSGEYNSIYVIIILIFLAFSVWGIIRAIKIGR